MQKKDIRNPLTIVSCLLIKAPYKPTGDQPQAIAELVKGFKEGNQCQTFTIWDNYFWTVRKNKKMFKGAFKWKKLLNGYKSIKK